MITLPSIAIHIWGGFGSQLYAVALYYKLLRLHPNRRFHIVQHTGGIILRRENEFSKLFRDIPVRHIDDHRSDGIAPTTWIRPFVSIRGSVIRVLRLLSVKSGLMIDDSILRKNVCIKPWTLQIRGHYTDIVFDLSDYTLLLTQLQSRAESIKTFDLNSTMLHYRLGDLPFAGKENIIPIDVIEKQFDQVPISARKTVYVFSDTPTFFSTKPFSEDFYASHNVIISDLSASSLIPIASSAKAFVGTSSKLSIWIVLFRSCLGLNHSFLPNSLKENFLRNNSIFLDSDIRFYNDKV